MKKCVHRLCKFGSKLSEPFPLTLHSPKQVHCHTYFLGGVEAHFHHVPGKAALECLQNSQPLTQSSKHCYFIVKCQEHWRLTETIIIIITVTVVSYGKTDPGT